MSLGLTMVSVVALESRRGKVPTSLPAKATHAPQHTLATMHGLDPGYQRLVVLRGT
jgi:hypothetical protein